MCESYKALDNLLKKIFTDERWEKLPVDRLKSINVGWKLLEINADTKILQPTVNIEFHSGEKDTRSLWEVTRDIPVGGKQ